MRDNIDEIQNEKFLNYSLNYEIINIYNDK